MIYFLLKIYIERVKSNFPSTREWIIRILQKRRKKKESLREMKSGLKSRSYILYCSSSGIAF